MTEQEYRMLVIWMDRNKNSLYKIYNDEEVVKIKDSNEVFKVKEESVAQEIVAICKFVDFLIREENRFIIEDTQQKIRIDDINQRLMNRLLTKVSTKMYYKM
jgi:site-specific recombinase XerD